MGRLAASQRREARTAANGASTGAAATARAADCARADVEEASDALREAKRRVSLATTTSTYKRLVTAFVAGQTLPEAAGMLLTAKQRAEQCGELREETVAVEDPREGDQQLLDAAPSVTASGRTASPAVAPSIAPDGASPTAGADITRSDNANQPQQAARQHASQPLHVAQIQHRRQVQPSIAEPGTQFAAAEPLQLPEQSQHGLADSFMRSAPRCHACVGGRPCIPMKTIRF